MTDRRPLGEVSHTNPYTGEAFGETQTYGRGRLVAADGGEADEAGTEPEAAERDTTLKSVDHTRDGAPSANAAYDRDDGANAKRSRADSDSEERNSPNYSSGEPPQGAVDDTDAEAEAE